MRTSSAGTPTGSGRSGTFHLQPIELHEASGKTVVLVHFHGRLKGSGDIVDMREVWVLSWRDDRIIEIREYKNKPEALEAVGLEE
jgi:ketosteroid isomerase-like protein